MMIRLEVPTRSAARAERINAAVEYFSTKFNISPATITAALDAIDKPKRQPRQRRKRNDPPRPDPTPRATHRDQWIKEPTLAALGRAQAAGAHAIARMQVAVARARAALAEANADEAHYP
jgi:hypothetical protein